MKHRVRLRLEQLEDRCTPSALGQPWSNPGQLTLSFAPDGTLVNGAPSSLFQNLNRLGPTSQWQQIVLKAVQAWVPTTNVNISVVADGGQPFGTDGSVQGDSRFGDIRIGMASLPANLVATTAPFSWTGSTWSGDILLNSSYNFGLNGQGQYDLATVVMHEAGHALGIPDNTADTGSIMYANYTGARTALDSLDVSNIQALYGARSGDAFDAAHANDTLATATPIGNSPSQLGFNADLTTASDVDYYKIQTPLLDLGLSSMTIKVNAAGMSMLTPTVSVFDASGRLLATQTALSPFANTVTVTIPYPRVLATYYFEVSHVSADGFAVGDYAVDVTYKSLLGSLLGGIVPSLLQGTVNTVNHVNSALTSASLLTAAFGNTSDQRFSYLYHANLAYGGDADYYHFTVPAISASTGAYALDAMVWQAAPGGLAPALHFFDGSGKPMAARVMADSNSVYALQLLGVTAGQHLYVEVAGQVTQGPSSTGFYVLGIKFNQQPETVAPALGSATLGAAAVTDGAMLAMNQNGVFYFELAAANGGAPASSNVTMTVYGPDGAVALAFTVAANAAPRTTAVFLPAGVYTIVYTACSSAAVAPPTTYWVSGEILSDPIGPYYASASAVTSPSTSGSSTNSSATSGSSTSGSSTSGSSTISSTKTFNPSGASVTINTPSGSISVPIPPPGGSWSQSFTTSVGVTTVSLTTASDGATTLTLTTPSSNTITDSTTTSGNTSTETLATSDGIRVTIVTPVTTAAPTYSGSSTNTDQPFYY